MFMKTAIQTYGYVLLGKGSSESTVPQRESSRVLIISTGQMDWADDVKTIYEDREGNLWSGNYGQGLTLITPKTFSVYSFDDARYGNNILSFFSIRNTDG